MRNHLLGMLLALASMNAPFSMLLSLLVKNTALIFFTFMLSSISTFASAEQTCASRKDARESTFVKYPLDGKKESRRREVILYCTAKEDTVKVVLRDSKTARVLQSFETSQAQTYLEASTPDLDSDGYSDLVLVTAWGSPNMTFKAWRYDPIQDRLKVALEDDGGTEFVRTKSGDIVVHAKGGADAWSYTIFKWEKSRLVRTYSIEEQMDDSAECTYSDISNSANSKPIKNRKVLNQLKSYCGAGGAGLLEKGENLLHKE